MNAEPQRGSIAQGDGGTGGTREAAHLQQQTFPVVDPQRALTDQLMEQVCDANTPHAEVSRHNKCVENARIAQYPILYWRLLKGPSMSTMTPTIVHDWKDIFHFAWEPVTPDPEGPP
jgi:hypothetical protein